MAPHPLGRIAEETVMPKPEWGVKRTCLSCGARFYDLMRDPIVCPKCEAVFDVTAGERSQSGGSKSKKASEAKAKPVVDEADLIDDEDSGDTASEDDDTTILEDDEDDDAGHPTLSDEESDEDDPVQFQDDVLIDDDENDLDDLDEVAKKDEDT